MWGSWNSNFCADSRTLCIVRTVCFLVNVLLIVYEMQHFLPLQLFLLVFLNSQTHCVKFHFFSAGKTYWSFLILHSCEATWLGGFPLGQKRRTRHFRKKEDINRWQSTELSLNSQASWCSDDFCFLEKNSNVLIMSYLHLGAGVDEDSWHQIWGGFAHTVLPEVGVFGPRHWKINRGILFYEVSVFFWLGIRIQAFSWLRTGLWGTTASENASLLPYLTI